MNHFAIAKCCLFLLFQAIYTESLNIAIIGGGSAGLFTAHYLMEDGFGDIDIFEADDELAIWANSLPFDDTGNIFDVGTVCIPAHFFAHDQASSGVSPDFQEILDLVDVQLEPTFLFGELGPRYFNTSSGNFTIDHGFPAFSGSPEQLISELISGIEMFGAAQAPNGIQGIYESGIALPGETLSEWAERHNTPDLGYLMALYEDIAGANPIAATQSASEVISASAFWRIGTIRSLLLSRGLSASVLESMGVPLPDFTKFVLSNPSPLESYKFTNGYQSFYDDFGALLESRGAHIYLNSRVNLMEYHDDHVHVHIDGNTIPHTYDAAIVTIGAGDYSLLGEHPMAEYFERLEQGPNHFWMTYTVETNIVGERGAVLMYPNVLELGNPVWDRLQDCSPVFISKEFPDSDVFFSFTWVLDDVDDAACKDRMVEDLNEWGIGVTEIMGFGRQRWPSKVSPQDELDGWFEDVHDLQSTNNVFVSGEVFSGISVPAVLDYVKKYQPELVEALRQIEGTEDISESSVDGSSESITEDPLDDDVSDGTSDGTSEYEGCCAGSPLCRGVMKEDFCQAPRCRWITVGHCNNKP